MELSTLSFSPFAGDWYFLNSAIYYDNPEATGCKEVKDDLIACISRLIEDADTKDFNRVAKIKNVLGLFEIQMAIRQRKQVP